MIETRTAPAAALVLLLAAIGCAGPAEEAPEPEEATETAVAQEAAETVPAATVGDLEIRDPRASLSPAGTGAVYLTVTATGEAADRLLGVTTAAAGSATLHESVDRDGVHRMEERPEGFEVPAGGSVELAPGGKHVMLMGLADGTAEGGSLPLTLRFERAGEVEVEVPVEGPGGMDHGHGGMEHGEMGHDDIDHGEMEHGEGEAGHDEMEHDH